MTSHKMTYALAREAFTYDPETGEVFWNPDRPQSHFPTEKGYRQWRGRSAGKVAGAETRSGHKYATFTFPDGRRRAIAMHQVAWMLANNKDIPSGKLVDHLNGNRGDNRAVNIRVVGEVMSARNTRQPRKPSTGVNGVYEVPSGYQVRLTIEPRTRAKTLGYFDDLETAIKVRKAVALSLGYTLRHLGLEGSDAAQ